MMKSPQVPRPPEWTERARCLGTDTELFYVTRGCSDKTAKAMCACCPVAAECLGWAMARNEQWGIYGGLSARQRRSLRAAKRAAA